MIKEFVPSKDFEETKALLGKRIEKDDEDVVVCFMLTIDNVSIEGQAYFVGENECYQEDLQYLRCTCEDGVWQSDGYVNMPKKFKDITSYFEMCELLETKILEQ